MHRAIARLAFGFTFALTLNCLAASAAPVASDFILMATPGTPGHFTVINNSSGWYVTALQVDTPDVPSNISTTHPNWVIVDTFPNNYSYNAFNGFNDLSIDVGPGQSASHFFLRLADASHGHFLALDDRRRPFRSRHQSLLHRREYSLWRTLRRSPVLFRSSPPASARWCLSHSAGGGS